MAAKKLTFTEAIARTAAMRGPRAKAQARIDVAKAHQLAPAAPDAAITAYNAALGKYAARVERLVERKVLSRLPEVGSGDPLDLVALQLGLADLELDLVALAPKLARFARAAGARTAAHAEREVARLMRVRINDPRRTKALVDDFTTRNVALLRKVAFDQVARIKHAIATYQEGESMRARILHSLWVTRNRGKLIARDQPHKFANEVQRAWCAALGSTEYVYVTRRDEHVRRSHRPHDGKRFRWDQPPASGHPGTEPNCRCAAVPVEALV